MADNYPKPSLLHILHSWGGGIARWTEDFIQHYPERRHLILYSVSNRNIFGQGLELVDSAYPERPLATWELTPPIPTTALTHPQYKTLLSDLLTGLAVETVVVSSLIGHSLDALDTGRLTLRVLHDLYPYCPAMFGYFGASCERCNQDSLAHCLESNPHNECWHNSTAEHWLATRQVYAAAILQPQVYLVAPSRTARDRLYQLYPEIAAKTCHLIPHGTDLERLRRPVHTTPSNNARDVEHESRKLRIVVPGRLEFHKGLPLLQEALPRLTKQAEFLLLGCGLFAQSFTDIKGITLVPDYNLAELSTLIQNFSPDCALLLSTLPETFSYTLSEMWALGIPTLATALGAFRERIQHGINGFLYPPTAQDLIALVTSLAKERVSLGRVAHHLDTHPIRQARDMVQDYQALLPTLSNSLTQGNWLPQGIENAQIRNHSTHTRLKQETCRQAAELAESRHQLNEMSQMLSYHQAHTKTLERELIALRHSNSWRMTAPLRALRTHFHPKPPWAANQNPPPIASGRETSTLQPTQNISKNRSLLQERAHTLNLSQRLTGRIHLRERLGIPDAARIMLGLAQTDQPEAVQDFISAASRQMDNQRNLYFLWCEGDDISPLPAGLKARGLAMAPRRLFFIQATAASLPEYLIAADLIYLPMAGDKSQPHLTKIKQFRVPVISTLTDHALITTLSNHNIF
ncbi:glycosyltransferase family 4 protein [Nitrosococcus watsonii]|uniref:Glycosyl transferase group 1 n=1 Tax=Nitrosococcus watsoni (strain C-113) TaxID=105559 RepID=D8K4G1_NITWC|nr:glycosyltransferase family 4 protein [Nitrosococcus watsonii]ADJ27858.1 glycosyl transferase group 1 [Nitrosococcus watsonii C-113]